MSSTVEPEPQSPQRREVAELWDDYRRLYDGDAAGVAARKEQYRQLVDEYYELVTDFYLYGWGDSFHFAPRFPGEGFRASLKRYQLYLARKLDLGPEDRVLDVGCGVGGPMMTIASTTGAHVTGVNISEYQIRKGREFLKARRLEDRCEFLHADFMDMPVPEGSYTAACSIESTCHAPDRVGVFQQIRRALQSGGRYAGYEWVVTDRFRATDPEHQRIKAAIEVGTGLPDLARPADVLDALREAGFTILECCDRAAESHPRTPWWRPLTGRDWSLKSLPKGPKGRRLTQFGVRWLERLGFAPKGSAAVQQLLLEAGDALVAGGESGIFTPMYYYLVEKP